MQSIASGDSDNVDLNALKHDFADLKKRADSTPNSDDLKALVVRRALGGLVIGAYESGQHSMEGKDYRAALAYFDLAAAGIGQSGLCALSAGAEPTRCWATGKARWPSCGWRWPRDSTMSRR
jgi:hypothetical protein